MKNRFSLVGMLFAGMMILVLGLSSCSKGSSDTKKGLVPKDASMVIELDVKQLVLKSNFLMYKDDIAELIDAEGHGDHASKRFAQAMREVDDGGMNFNKPVYIFTTADCDGVFVVTSVRNKEEIISNLKDLDKRTRIIEDEGEGIVWAETDGEKFAAITDEAFLIGAAKNDHLFRQILTGGGGFFDTPMGKVFSAHRGDMTVALNPQAITPRGRRNLSDMLHNSKLSGMLENERVWEVFQQLQLVSNVKFSKGEMAINAYSADNEPFDPVFIPISQDVFDQIPVRGTLGVLAAGINGEEMAKAIRRELEKDGERPDASVSIFLSALKDVKGSLALSFGMDDGYRKQPEMIVTLPVDKTAAQMLSSLISQRFDLPLYVSGGYPYSAVSTMRNYQYGSIQNRNRLRERAAGCKVYGFFSFEDLYEIMLQDHLRNGGHGASNKLNIAAQLVEVFKFLEMKMTSEESVSLILTMQNDQRNSLDVMLKEIIDIAKDLMTMSYLPNYPDDVVPYNNDPFEDEWEELEEVAW